MGRWWGVTVIAAALLTLLTPVAQASADPAQACAPVALFAVPGTHETSDDTDPAVPAGMLAGLTTPLAQRSGERLHVEYVPYPASFDRPVFYLTSERRGLDTLAAAVTGYAARCPDTTITLVGYSQGADVVSDLLHRAVNHTVALAPERIAGAVMLGSPRRDPRAVNLVDTPGRGILGARPTRELTTYGDRVVEVCAPADPICATENLDVRAFREGWASGAHHAYPELPIGPEASPLFTVLGAAFDTVVTNAGDSAD